MREIVSFPPIIDENTRILILGTMPGEESLRRQQYYGNPRNQFWRIVYALFGQEPESSYKNKKAFLLNKGIGLWDVIGHCRRKGSLDSNIEKEAPNDFIGLYTQFPQIKRLLFNGRKAHDFYKQYIVKSAPDLPYSILPSTSPAYTLSYEEKLALWKTSLGRGIS